jgi:hypothetical protein
MKWTLQVSKGLNGAKKATKNRSMWPQKGISEAAVADSALKQSYEQMAATFLERGIDVKFVNNIKRYFSTGSTLSHSQEAQPYSQLEEGSLPPNGVRLLVLPVAPHISSYGAHAPNALEV